LNQKRTAITPVIVVDVDAIVILVILLLSDRCKIIFSTIGFVKDA
jgi:hypothetical protein